MQVGQITNIANTIQSSLTGSGTRVRGAGCTAADHVATGCVALPRLTGRICVHHVTFRYPQADPVAEPALQDVSFEVNPGQCLGIMGATGAGKSTLLSLLARFYDVTSGAVLVDDIDVRDLFLDDLRRNIGMVYQESFLFSNTVSANIAFGHPDASLADIERAARLASADEFIRELPDGYEAVVGEYGSNLSGGQRQRLAIARALLLDPPLLVLDDATAAVDPETEREIRTALQSARQGRTTVVVSNRISTLRDADQIIVLHHGRIVERGTHRELLRGDGSYRRLAELQFADQVEETPVVSE